MQIHHVRNATMIIESGSERILLDPMLGAKGSLPPYAFFRHCPRRNPTVSLPTNMETVLDRVTVGLITHCRGGHFDHLDRAGARFLAKNKIPVYCNQLDEHHLQKRHINTIPLKPNQQHEFLEGRITPFETAHGYGLVGKLMGKGLGYLLELPNEPSVYISGDTVLTPIVKQVLTGRQPDIAILNAGGASLDIGKPILMPMKEMIEYIRLAPGIVIATHMEALNHCPVTRNQLRNAVSQAGMTQKVRIPLDGETLVL